MEIHPSTDSVSKLRKIVHMTGPSRGKSIASDWKSTVRHERLPLRYITDIFNMPTGEHMGQIVHRYPGYVATVAIGGTRVYYCDFVCITAYAISTVDSEQIAHEVASTKMWNLTGNSHAWFSMEISADLYAKFATSYFKLTPIKDPIVTIFHAGFPESPPVIIDLARFMVFFRGTWNDASRDDASRDGARDKNRDDRSNALVETPDVYGAFCENGIYSVRVSVVLTEADADTITDLMSNDLASRHVQLSKNITPAVKQFLAECCISGDDFLEITNSDQSGWQVWRECISGC